MTKNGPYPWSRIEKWAKQLLEGMCQLHAKGLTLGTLCSGISMPTLVDTSDNIHFWRFKAKFKLGYQDGCYYPPEYGDLRDASQILMDAGDSPRLTPKADIFHLGMALWLMAENLPYGASPVCLRERCASSTKLSQCNESHRDPVALPPLPESIPQYHQETIRLCRAPNPNDRPAAWRLLKLFPVFKDSSYHPIESSKSRNLDFYNIYQCIWREDNVCSVCQQSARIATCYQCNVCQNGDFDVCINCFRRGVHCQSDNHLMVAMEPAPKWNVPEKFYSKQNADGTRDVIEI